MSRKRWTRSSLLVAAAWLALVAGCQWREFTGEAEEVLPEDILVEVYPGSIVTNKVLSRTFKGEEQHRTASITLETSDAYDDVVRFYRLSLSDADYEDMTVQGETTGRLGTLNWFEGDWQPFAGQTEGVGLYFYRDESVNRTCVDMTCYRVVQ